MLFFIAFLFLRYICVNIFFYVVPFIYLLPTRNAEYFDHERSCLNDWDYKRNILTHKCIVAHYCVNIIMSQLTEDTEI